MIPKLYVVLVNYKGWRDTIECLESLLKSDYKNFQIFIVDNCSPDDSIANICAWADGKISAEVVNLDLEYLSRPETEKPVGFQFVECNSASFKLDFDINERVVLIRSPNNGGFAFGNNLAVNKILEKGDADYILFLNADTVVERQTLSSLIDQMLEYRAAGKKIGMLGAKLMYYYNPDYIQGVGGVFNTWLFGSKHFGSGQKDLGQFDYELSEKLDYIIGACMLVPVGFIEDVGLMCEDYFLYFEEIDWATRAKDKGWELGYSWKTRVFHKEGGSIGSSSIAKEKSWLADYYGFKGRFTFMENFYPRRAFFLYLITPIVLFNRVRRCQFNRVWPMLKIVFGLDRVDDSSRR